MKKLTPTLKIHLFFVAILISVVSPHPVLAQESPQTVFYLSITPPTAYLKIHPGNLALHTVTLKNNGTQTIVVTPKLVDFISDGISGQPILTNNSSFPYIDLDRTSFSTATLNPGSTAQLTMHFSVPGTAENHEYPLTILFEARSSEQLSGQTAVTGTIGSNLVILISDSDYLDQQFAVSSFGSFPVIDSFQPLQFAPILKNNSYAAGVASGSAQITNWQGTVVAQYEIVPTVILGYSTRQIQPLAIEENQAYPAVEKNGLRIFSYKSAFLIGPHTISIFTLSGNPNNTQLIEHKMIVWALPISILIAAAVALLLITVYYLYRSKKFFF